MKNEQLKISLICFGVAKCCPTFITPQATKEITREAAGRTSKLKSNE